MRKALPITLSLLIAGTASATMLQLLPHGNYASNWRLTAEHAREQPSFQLSDNPDGIFSFDTLAGVISLRVAGSFTLENPTLLFPSGFVQIHANNEFWSFALPPSGGYLRAGETIDNALDFTAYNPSPLNTKTYQYYKDDIWLNDAQAGTDNFLGFRMLDINGDWHYGYMQFELREYIDGELGIKVLGAVVNSIAGEGVELVTLVPEPSTYALLAGAAMLGVVALRRRNHRQQRVCTSY